MAERREVFIEKTTACVFCKRFTKDEVDFGGLKVTKNLHAHYYCLLQSKTIERSGSNNQGILGFLPEDIAYELWKSLGEQCFYCKEYGATLGCGHKHCNRKFHLPCGIMKNTQYNFNIHTNYCDVHRKPPNVPTHIKISISSYQCMICLENFIDNSRMSEMVWADCCKSDIVLHIRCIKQMALSTGYFTKCPGCNNHDQFVNTIKSYGVFVPERDASWELGENAFAELLYVHKQCDIEKCLCPQGKMYSEKQGKWLIRLCNLCGSYGAHDHCSRLRNNITCDTCNIKNRESSTNTSFDGAFQSIDSAIATFEEMSNLSCSNNPRTLQSNDFTVAISRERSTAGCSNSGSVLPRTLSSSRLCSTFDSIEENFKTDWYSISNHGGINDLENKPDLINIDCKFLRHDSIDIKEEIPETVACKSTSNTVVADKSTSKKISKRVADKFTSKKISKRVADKFTSKKISKRVADKSTSKKISKRVADKLTAQLSRKRALRKQHKELLVVKRSMSQRCSREFSVAGTEQENWAPAKPDTNTNFIMYLDNEDLFVKITKKGTNGLNTDYIIQNIKTQHCPMPGKNTETKIIGATDGFQDTASVVNDTTSNSLLSNTNIPVQAHKEEECMFKPGKLQPLLEVDIDEKEDVVLGDGNRVDDDWLSKVAITDIKTINEDEPSFCENAAENGDESKNCRFSMYIPITVEVSEQLRWAIPSIKNIYLNPQQ